MLRPSKTPAAEAWPKQAWQRTRACNPKVARMPMGMLMEQSNFRVEQIAICFS